VATVVMQGSGVRVRDVLVAGAFAKRDGRLLRTDVDVIRHRLSLSGERILAKLGVGTTSTQVAHDYAQFQ
jgi:hypothetical protein